MHCIQRNLRDAFPHLDAHEVEQTAQDIAANFGRHIAEMAHARTFRNSKHGASLELDKGQSTLFDDQQKAIYVGAHLGSWELAPLALEQHGRSVTVIYSEDKNSTTNRVAQALRRDIGGHYLSKSSGLRHIVDVLTRGSPVALLVDQRVDYGLEVNFFDRRSVMTRLPARLAIKYDCPIVPFEVIRIAPGRLRAVLLQPIIPFDGGGKKSETELTQEMADSIQASIERNKSSWFCNTRRWPDRQIVPISGDGKVEFKSRKKKMVGPRIS